MKKELFDVPESLSPKEAWLRENNVVTYPVHNGVRAMHRITGKDAVADDEVQALDALCEKVHCLTHWQAEEVKGDKS